MQLPILEIIYRTTYKHRIYHAYQFILDPCADWRWSMHALRHAVFGWFIVRVCLHDIGHAIGYWRSVTYSNPHRGADQVHSALSSLLVTHASTNRGQRAFRNMPLSKPSSQPYKLQFNCCMSTVRLTRDLCAMGWFICLLLSGTSALSRQLVTLEIKHMRHVKNNLK